jgi:hypothetical protein
MSFSDSKQGEGSANLGDRQGKDSPVHHALMMSPLVAPGVCIRTSDNNYTGVRYQQKPQMIGELPGLIRWLIWKKQPTIPERHVYRLLSGASGKFYHR